MKSLHNFTYVRYKLFQMLNWIKLTKFSHGRGTFLKTILVQTSDLDHNLNTEVYCFHKWNKRCERWVESILRIQLHHNCKNTLLVIIQPWSILINIDSTTFNFEHFLLSKRCSFYLKQKYSLYSTKPCCSIVLCTWKYNKSWFIYADSSIFLT